MAQTILFHVGLVLFAVAAMAGVWVLRDPLPLRIRTLRGILGLAVGSLFIFLAVEAVEIRALPLTGLFHSLLVVTLLVAAAGLAADLALRIPVISLGASAAGLAALLVALVAAPASGPAREFTSKGWIGLHIACMLVAYAAFALGCLSGMLFLFAESNLKRKRRLELVESLPSLETLEELQARALGVGFLLFTIGLIVGYQVRRVETSFATDWRLDPKVIWTGLTWLAYLGVLIARQIPWFRGRRAAFLAVLGFLFVLFTYFGARTGFHVFDAPPPAASPSSRPGP
jgi:ABC-type uncharacterized transport system permease subunit